MTCDTAREQIPSYVLGALGQGERSGLEAHLRRCSECAVELESSVNAIGHLAAGVPQVDPPPALKNALFDRVRRDAQGGAWLAHFSAARFWRPALATAMIVTLVAVSVASFNNRQELRELGAQTQDLRMLVENQAEPVELTTQPAREQYALVSMLARPDKNIYWAERNTRFPDVRGMLLTSGNSRWGVVATVGLDMLPKEQKYRIWLQQDGRLAPGGSFTVDEDGWGQLTLRPPEPLSMFQSIIVTIEPQDGSSEPTGPQVFRVNMTPDE